MRPVNTGNREEKSADLWTETQEYARRTYHLPTSPDGDPRDAGVHTACSFYKLEVSNVKTRLPGSPYRNSRDTCIILLADILYRACAGSRDRILAAIAYLEIPQSCQGSLVEFFSNVQLQLTRYKLYLYFYEPIPLAGRGDTAEPTVACPWPFMKTTLSERTVL
ncbi:hypothetical protein Bbelb_036050 [Branchiostoma belcheri]|nr:hypothetical protein Bbelb_036050 [Branchiostoma belcheri]